MGEGRRQRGREGKKKKKAKVMKKLGKNKKLSQIRGE
jgi:hypothetical protein